MSEILLTNISIEDLARSISQLIAVPAKQEDSPAEIISREELCKRLNITRPTAIRWEKKGKIPSIKIGSACRYNWPKVVAALEKK
jgi:excisionase family DNA binding protein